jgi:hypothetical protein
MPNYVFSKGISEKYNIKFTHTGDWADFTLDDTGLLNCYSSFGSFSYCWPAYGNRGFKYFIVHALADDPEYLLEKICLSQIVNVEKTITAWKKRLLKDRRNREIDEGPVREMWEGLDDLLSDPYNDGYTEMVMQEKIQGIVDQHYDGWEVEVVTDYPAGYKQIAYYVMPIFAEILKKEEGF